MRNKEKDAIQIAKKRKAYIESAYKLFSTGDIESVTLQDIADATEYGIATLYRYFVNKPNLVVEVAAYKWEQFAKEIWERRDKMEQDSEMTAAERFDVFFLSSFLEVYQNHSDLLRFNQFFTAYIQKEKPNAEVMRPYGQFIKRMMEEFHSIYEAAKVDKTLRTDVTEEEMFSTNLHLMLAVVTRYAVGLAYKPKSFDAMKELEIQKNALLNVYRT